MRHFVQFLTIAMPRMSSCFKHDSISSLWFKKDGKEGLPGAAGNDGKDGKDGTDGKDWKQGF